MDMMTIKMESPKFHFFDSQDFVTKRKKVYVQKSRNYKFSAFFPLFIKLAVASFGVLPL